MSNKKSNMSITAALLAFLFIFSVMMVGQTMAAAAAKIDLNKATSEQLGKFPGLTLALAKSIIEYREKSGPFKMPEDLMKVKGVTKEILNKLNPKLEKGILYVTPSAPESDEDEEEPSLKPSKC
ncbi:MAG: helix-hairpin-helix domain-containing protein [Acidobacteria bacterium]|nr:helix-hairpin-helix domain-containing protein [Acidobacteriota bacterium]